MKIREYRRYRLDDYTQPIHTYDGMFGGVYEGQEYNPRGVVFPQDPDYDEYLERYFPQAYRRKYPEKFKEDKSKKPAPKPRKIRKDTPSPNPSIKEKEELQRSDPQKESPSCVRQVERSKEEKSIPNESLKETSPVGSHYPEELIKFWQEVNELDISGFLDWSDDETRDRKSGSSSDEDDTRKQDIQKEKPLHDIPARKENHPPSRLRNIRHNTPSPNSKKSSSVESIDKTPTKSPEIRKGRFIGKGGMGSVYNCRIEGERGNLALKIMPIPKEGKEREMAEQEVELLRALDHPNIVPLVAIERKSISPTKDNPIRQEEFWMVMELFDESLGNILRNKKDGWFSESEMIRWAIEILKGLEYLHKKRIAHRDLKVWLSKFFLVEIRATTFWYD